MFCLEKFIQSKKDSLVSLIAIHTNKSNMILHNNYICRTEFYLQQREKQNVNKSPSTTMTIWKNFNYQRQNFR